MITSKTFRQLTMTALMLFLSACGEEIAGPDIHEFDYVEGSKTTHVNAQPPSALVEQPSTNCTVVENRGGRGRVLIKNCTSGEQDPFKP